ncbi:TolB family protein [Nannocystis pusilla]|uniref:TolB family protein n=1 Tax=Nannocystis pusilla TaxID=889268 RepID=UPI003DA44388
MRELLCMAPVLSLVMSTAGCDPPGEHPPEPDLRDVLTELAEGAECPDSPTFAPGIVSSPAEEWRIAFTPDGKTAYFGVSAEFFPIARQATIMVTHLVDGAWTVPEVASFSGQYSDIDPFISPDGSRLYFSSIRPVDGQPRTDTDLWLVERGPGGEWGEPVHLGAAVNSPADELYPSVTADGELLFGSDRDAATRGWDIFRAEATDGVFGPAEPIAGAVNTEVWEFNPWIAADGQVLVFTGLDRPGGHGLGDLWASFRGEDGTWGPVLNLGPCVNSPRDEYHPTLDRGRLFFVRHSYEPWEAGDLHELKLPAGGD